MNVAIRVDASEKVGSGHFFRTFLLAKHLKKNNQIHFISKNLNKEYIRKLNREKFVLHNISVKKNSSSEDASQTISKLKKIDKAVDLLIIDNYKLGFDWEIKIKKYVKKILVIDDFLKKHHCNIYLNYNIYKVDKKYLPNSCLKLLGPKYIILNPLYLKKSKKTILSKKKFNIFIFMGGADKNQFTLKFAKYFKKLKFNNFIFNFVLGINNKKNKDILKISKKVKNYKIYYNLENLKSLLLKSDLGITNGGQVIWELIYNKIPNIIFCKNKYRNNIILKFRKIIKAHIFEVKVKKSIKSYIKDLDHLLINYKCYFKKKLQNNKLIDGKGLERISKKINIHT